MERPFPNSDYICLDIETTGLDFLHDGILLLTLSDGTETLAIEFFHTNSRFATTLLCTTNGVPYLSFVVGLENEIDRRWGLWLEDEVYDRTVIVHNAMFDLPFLAHHMGCGYPNLVWDTMICEQLLSAGLTQDNKNAGNRQERISLKTLAQTYLNIELDKSLQVSFVGGSGPLTPEQIEYAKEDARILFPIMMEQKHILSREELNDIWDIEMNSIPVWCSMKEKGIYLDADLLKPVIDAAQMTIDELGKSLQEELTYHVQDLRLQKWEEKQSVLDGWLQDLADETVRLEEGWGDVWLPYYWSDDFVSSNDPETAARLQSWVDDYAVDPKDGQYKGQKRYVKWHLKQFREEHPRPPKPAALVKEPINLGSPEQVKYALEACLGIEVKDTRANTLKLLIPELENREQQRLVQTKLDYQEALKLVQSFGQKLIDSRDAWGFVHAEWAPYGAASGRPTASTPNLLQIPKRKKISKQMRRAFKPREGHVFVVCDYSQFELRILADASRDPSFIKAFKNGEDPHRQTAIDSLGKQDVSDQERNLFKTANYLICYGGGENKLIQSTAESGVYLTKQEAKKIMNSWKTAHKVAWNYLMKQQNKAVSEGYTESILGRKRWFVVEEGEYVGGIQRAGANHVLQSSNADVSKIAMACIQKALTPLGGHVALQVYDEIVAEVPIEHAELGALIVKESMLEAARKVLRYVPPEVDCTISRSWSDEDAIELKE